MEILPKEFGTQGHWARNEAEMKIGPIHIEFHKEKKVTDEDAGLADKPTVSDDDAPVPLTPAQVIAAQAKELKEHAATGQPMTYTPQPEAIKAADVTVTEDQIVQAKAILAKAAQTPEIMTQPITVTDGIEIRPIAAGSLKLNVQPVSIKPPTQVQAQAASPAPSASPAPPPAPLTPAPPPFTPALVPKTQENATVATTPALPAIPAPVPHSHNGFITFLDKLGNGVAKVGDWLVHKAPAIEAATKVIASDVAIFNPGVGAIILGAEQIAEGIMKPIVDAQQKAAQLGGTATGIQKLGVAAPAVEQILLSYPGLAGKKPTDQAKYEATVTGIASLLADFLLLFPGDDAPAA